MTKLLSITTSLLILIQSFGIHIDDIAEFDELIEHAQFHAEEYGDNFLVFVSKHYGELKADHNEKHQEEKEDHERLPFQHQCSISSLSAFVLNQLPDYPLALVMAVHSNNTFFYQASYPSLVPEGLFQPPRLA